MKAKKWLGAALLAVCLSLSLCTAVLAAGEKNPIEGDRSMYAADLEGDPWSSFSLTAQVDDSVRIVDLVRVELHARRLEKYEVQGEAGYWLFPAFPIGNLDAKVEWLAGCALRHEALRDTAVWETVDLEGKTFERDGGLYYNGVCDAGPSVLMGTNDSTKCRYLRVTEAGAESPTVYEVDFTDVALVTYEGDSHRPIRDLDHPLYEKDGGLFSWRYISDGTPEFSAWIEDTGGNKLGDLSQPVLGEDGRWSAKYPGFLKAYTIYELQIKYSEKEYLGDPNHNGQSTTGFNTLEDINAGADAGLPAPADVSFTDTGAVQWRGDWTEDGGMMNFLIKMYAEDQPYAPAYSNTAYLERKNGVYSYPLSSYADLEIDGQTRLKDGTTYTVQVQAVENSGERRESEFAQSANSWTYWRPEERLATPTGAAWAYPKMTWQSESGDLALWNYVGYYYAKEEGAKLVPVSGTFRMKLNKGGWADNSVFVKDLPRIVANMRKNVSANSGYTADDINEDGSGYYYFTVRTASADPNKARCSEESAPSGSIFYDGKAFQQTGGYLPAQIKLAGKPVVSEGKITFSIEVSSPKEGVMLAVGFRDGCIADVEYTAKQKGDFSLNGTSAKTFFLEEKTYIPLAVALEI